MRFADLVRALDCSVVAEPVWGTLEFQDLFEDVLGLLCKIPRLLSWRVAQAQA